MELHLEVTLSDFEVVILFLLCVLPLLYSGWKLWKEP